MPDQGRPPREFLLLAPNQPPARSKFTRVESSYAEHAERLGALQRLRGRLYLEDGAIEEWQLTQDGRHCLPTDDTSWHVLSVQGDQVLGCARLQFYAPTVDFAQLTVARSAQAGSPVWGERLRQAVTAELRHAQAEGQMFVEAGGWALSPELRFTTEGLQIALASFAVGDLTGGCIGLCTATVRHNSSTILRRLGGRSFESQGEALPAYFDPAYQCQMEILRFDTRQLNRRFLPMINEVRQKLETSRVLCGPPAPSAHSLMSLAQAVDSERNSGATEVETGSHVSAPNAMLDRTAN